jgi:arginine decarboxylase
MRDRPRRAWAPPATGAAAAPPSAPALTSPRAAALGRHECVPFTAATGRVCAQALSAYPPGIPTALPGEQLTPDVLAYLAATVADGGVVRGAAGGRLDEVRVLAEGDACSG